jgi:hypothetical protein
LQNPGNSSKYVLKCITALSESGNALLQSLQQLLPSCHNLPHRRNQLVDLFCGVVERKGRAHGGFYA